MSGSAPSADHRWPILQSTMKRHQFRPDALIEVLHSAQELFGYLPPDLLSYVARGLDLPPSQVYGVATFYHFFSLTPKGRHTCIICMGTACYVKGASNLLAAVHEAANLEPGETTRDGQLTMQTARCLGACGVAPAVVLDGVIVGHQSPETLRGFLKGAVDGRA